MNERWFGWKKDKYDHRDYLFKPKIIKIPDKVDLSQFLPVVRYQEANDCVGFGIGCNITSWATKLGVALPEIQYFSPTDIYKGALFIEGSNMDEGCWPRDALEWLRKKGCLPEKFWPYNGWEKRYRPSSLDVEAAEYPLVVYYRVDNGVDGIIQALAEGKFVSIGTPWYDRWWDTDMNGNLAVVKVGDYVVGGHETCLYGYNKSAKRFMGRNSWGEDWGDGGNFTMPFSAFDVFKSDGGYDAHYVELYWAGIPEPPTPEPEPPMPEPEKKTYGFRIQYTTDGGASWQKVIEYIISSS